MEYGHWVDEQNRQVCELRNALNAHISDVELQVLVENAMKHYFELFRMKAVASKADVFYIMCGLWKTSSERFFLWIGGFRPSELLKVTGRKENPCFHWFTALLNWSKILKSYDHIFIVYDCRLNPNLLNLESQMLIYMKAWRHVLMCMYSTLEWNGSDAITGSCASAPSSRRPAIFRGV